ncbi:hypothetical protein V8C86DRAFT_2601031 [Haematococcus lacustris]
MDSRSGKRSEKPLLAQGQQPGSPGAPPPSLPGGGFSPHPPMVSMDPGHKPGTLPPITAPLAGLLQPPPPEPPPAPPGTNSLAAIMAIIEPEWRGRVRTGMDVVEYFAANGHGARVKMMHAVRSDLTGTDCPYELVVTAKEVIAGDYYTMSASGVVHMHADGSPAEFTPIGDWVREHSVFNMMKQLPFFRTYMAHRMFRKWRKAARQQAFEKVRKALELRLFLAKPDFCFTLMDLRSKAHELRSLPLVEPEEQAQPLHDFAAQAAELRKHKIMPEVANLTSAVERSITRLFADVRKAEAVLQRQVDELDQQVSNAGHPVSALGGQGAATVGKGPPPKSIVKLRAERLERFRALRQVQQVSAVTAGGAGGRSCSRLGSW